MLGDALQYRLPDGPVICMIFNAFDTPTMKRVLHNIDAQADSAKRTVYVVYVNVRRVSEIGQVFNDLVNLRQVRADRKHILLANR